MFHPSKLLLVSLCSRHRLCYPLGCLPLRFFDLLVLFPVTRVDIIVDRLFDPFSQIVGVHRVELPRFLAVIFDIPAIARVLCLCLKRRQVTGIIVGQRYPFEFKALAYPFLEIVGAVTLRVFRAGLFHSCTYRTDRDRRRKAE